MKVLIITDERTGGTSFNRICGAMIGGLYVDDINTHFENFKHRNSDSWAYNFDIKNKIGLTAYFDKYETFANVDIYDMIIFLFSNGINVFKLTINNESWTEKQISDLINKLNSNNNNNFLIIKLIRQNNFNKILSKCVAIKLYEKIGSQAYDIKTEKHVISINLADFKYVCGIKMHTHQIINKIIVSLDNVFVYESFYENIEEVNRLQKLLNVDTINDPDLFAENYYKNYQSENVTVANIAELQNIFYTSYYH